MLFRVLGFVFAFLGGFSLAASMWLGFDLLYFGAGLLLISAGYQIGKPISYKVSLNPKLATWYHPTDEQSIYQIKVGDQTLKLGFVIPNSSGAGWLWARADIGDLSDQWGVDRGIEKDRMTAQVRVMQGWG